jgi:hypothetical protein
LTFIFLSKAKAEFVSPVLAKSYTFDGNNLSLFIFYITILIDCNPSAKSLLLFKDYTAFK